VPHTPRHALPAGRRAAVLPGLLLLALGGALGGMAVLPGPAAADSSPARGSVTSAARVQAASSPAERDAAADLAQALAQERRDERASRDRRPPPMPAAPAPPPPAPPPPPPVVTPPPPPPPPQFVRPGTGRLTSGYGSRWGRLHAGIDLAAGIGAPISAVAAGTVVAAGSEGGYGRAVRLQHDDGSLSLYAHMSELLVSAGQRVTPGTYLGLEGSSGHSTGPHLHFEIRVGGVPVDPEPWLRARGIDPAAQ
jgi:murein DD-endopeptidase MepM/ murein hydrolase activator NlpD